MTHLEIEHHASDYVEGQLDVAATTEMDRHLAECESCRTLIADLRSALERCRTAESLEAPPWLVPKILRATLGERQPTLLERLRGLLRPVREPRIAYTVAMAVFSISILVNATGLNLRGLSWRTLNPATWAYRANREGHLLAAHARRFYNDLRVVYEIQSRLRQLRSEPSGKSVPSHPRSGTSERTAPPQPRLACITGAVGLDVATGRRLSR